MEKEIFLTFDDGPNENTLKILEILKDFDAKATFFLCGKNAERFPEIVKKIGEDGNTIGNHTFSHSINFLWNFKKEIDKTEKTIQKITGKRTKIFRPPFGFLTPWLKSYLFKNGYKIILWDLDSKDWKKYPTDLIEETVLKGVKSNSVILFHNHLQTTFVLPTLLKRLKNNDYIFRKF